MKLEGVIEFAGPRLSLSAGTVHVFIEDASFADEAAAVVARQSVEIVGRELASTVSFSIDTGELTTARYYCLRVHVDVDGDGAISTGDYVTTQSYPVTEQSAALQVRVFPVS